MKNARIVSDFYGGFEGEPQIVITRRQKDGAEVTVLKLWVGYFDNLLDRISPNDDGAWEGVTLPFHLHSGWYDEPWECGDVRLFLRQLETIDAASSTSDKSGGLEESSLEVLQILKSMLTATINSNDRIIIEYF